MPYDGEGIGYRDVDTSKAARPQDVTGKRGIVLGALRRASLNCDEIAERTGLSAFTVRPRLTELRDLGFIHDTNVRRRLSSGRYGIVWGIKEGMADGKA